MTILLKALLFFAITNLASGVDSFRFETRTISENFARPMGMDLGPDGSVYLIEINGKLNQIHPKTGARTVLAELKVFADQENGLLGIALDPGFQNNQHLFLLYSPVDFVGQRISRFTIQDHRLIDEKTVIQWKTQRRECCHHGGMLKFGPDGCLYASAGDNTHPFGDSKSYAPIDRRPGREPWNAEKSSANPNDLRGGIIRIRVQPDASYTIPKGNLFPPGTPGTRPEIYIMGCRNPWKFSIDHKTGHLYWGDVGPDAGKDGPRGPKGHDEINQARKAGFFGWPYFIADNQPYSMVDFTNGKIGEKFNASAPVNNSPLNTGRENLPPAQAAFIYYPYSDSSEFPILKQGGRTACAGPVFHYQPEFEKSGGLPAHYDRCLLFWDWNRPFIKWARLDDQQRLQAIEDFPLPSTIKRPSDALFAPDGTLWLIDYGSTWGNNLDARLLHISYRHGNLPPVANFEPDRTHGPVPLNIKLDASGSTDLEGGQLQYAWSLNGTEFADAEEVTLQLTSPGNHTITLKVTDPQGAVDTMTQSIVAGNTPPSLAFHKPLDGSFFNPVEEIEFKIRVMDTEDGDSTKEPEKFSSAIVTLSPLARDAPGLSAIRSSDCFNCHHVSDKLIGPSFTAIAKRYHGNSSAFDQSVQRIISGSTKVWGEIPMLPHPNLDRNEVQSMVRWIYSLSDDKAPSIARGISGKLLPPPLSQPLDLTANYTDFGAHNGQVPAISGSTSIRLNPRTIQAEEFAASSGVKILESQNLKFIGSINHSQWTEYHRFRLEGCKSITFRHASAGPGATITVMANEHRIATAELMPTGDWNKWVETTVPLNNLPEGLVKLRLNFANPGKQHLMNLDSFRFGP